MTPSKEANLFAIQALLAQPSLDDRRSLFCTVKRLCSSAIGFLLVLHGVGIAETLKTISPPAQVVVQGIPPIPESLAQEVIKYTEFSGHDFAGWHPLGEGMLVVHRSPQSKVRQVFMLREPMAELQPLTEGRDPVAFASFEPKRAQYLVFGRDREGDEATQLYRLDLPSRLETLLTSPDERHSFKAWFHQGGRFIYSSVPLDRAGKKESHVPFSTRLMAMDPMHPNQSTLLAQLPGSGWRNAVLSEDDRVLAITREVSVDQSEVWLLDILSREFRRILPEPGSTKISTHSAVTFTPDGSGLFVLTDRFGEFTELALYHLGTQSMTRITPHIPWDVSSMSLSKDGRHLAVQINVNGKEVLRLFDGKTLAERSLHGSGNSIDMPEGSISKIFFQKNGHLLAVTFNSARTPGQIYALDADSGHLTQWTSSLRSESVDTSTFAQQQIIRWKSFDGLEISGLISRPPAKFQGRRPVLIQIHGGPSSQAKVGFLGRQQYLIQELGITFIQPNVRGSTGFGKTFTSLDNGRLREDAVRDIGALLDWITQQPDLDPSRVMVAGGSYGGYMSLAIATHYPDRIVGSVDSVGISHFVTFLESTESYRRDNRRLEYGDERDPAMREFLHQISPLTNAYKIRKPLYVVQGKNDPRVSWTEAEQIVAAVRANGVPVWYLRADNEGHSFSRKQNTDFEFFSRILFIREFLLR